LGGALSFLVANLGHDARKFDALKSIALCVVHLPEQANSVSATLTTTRPIEMFHVGLKTNASGGVLSILIAGDKGPIASASGIQSSSFGLGRAIQPGTYTVTLRQETNGKGAIAVIAGEEPAYVTGWQVWSRAYLGLLVLSGVFVFLSRKAKDSKKRAVRCLKSPDVRVVYSKCALSHSVGRTGSDRSHRIMRKLNKVANLPARHESCLFTQSESSQLNVLLKGAIPCTVRFNYARYPLQKCIAG
jgi:hypothetical protein